MQYTLYIIDKYLSMIYASTMIPINVLEFCKACVNRECFHVRLWIITVWLNFEYKLDLPNIPLQSWNSSAHQSCVKYAKKLTNKMVWEKSLALYELIVKTFGSNQNQNAVIYQLINQLLGTLINGQNRKRWRIEFQMAGISNQWHFQATHDTSFWNT